VVAVSLRFRPMAGAHLRTDGSSATRRIVVAAVVALLVGLAGGFLVAALVSTDDEGVVEAAGGVGAERDEGAAQQPTADQSTDGAGARASEGTAVAVPDPGPVTLAFVGDINVQRSLADRLASDPQGFVGPFADVLRGADLAVGNLEAALATGGSSVDKQFTFRAPPTVLDALRAGGLDVVSVANNHGVDFGSTGLEETIAVKRAQPDGMAIGVGADEDEAFAPHIAEVGGQRIAVIAATQVIDGQFIASWTAQADQPGLASAKRVDRLVEEVQAVRDDVDTVVVYLHWGTESEVCPSVAQQELARALVDAGADVIVGGHAHRVQSGGRLDGAFVGYGLGNFLFGAVSPDSAKTGVLLVEVDGREVLGYGWRPGTIVDGVPQPLDGDAAGAAVAEWEHLRGCTGLEP
jgi:poly-gamma-glutamate capsule biosynthesis protein CapA/YwtB (metallophosphatase superfamily)